MTIHVPRLAVSTLTSPMVSGAGAPTAPPTTWPRPAANTPSTTYHANRDRWLPISMKHAAPLITPSSPASTSHGGTRIAPGPAASTAVLSLRAHCRLVNANVTCHRRATVYFVVQSHFGADLKNAHSHRAARRAAQRARQARPGAAPRGPRA